MIVLPANVSRDARLAALAKQLAALPADKAWSIEVKEWKPKRSDAQNRTLWWLYDEIIEHGGEAMRGWTKDELHTFFCGERFGWETVDIFGRKKIRPARRSSRLSKMEFAELMEFIYRFMAERGVVLPTPNEGA